MAAFTFDFNQIIGFKILHSNTFILHYLFLVNYLKHAMMFDSRINFITYFSLFIAPENSGSMNFILAFNCSSLGEARFAYNFLCKFSEVN